MKKYLVALSCCIAMAAMLAYGQSADDSSQMARVVAIEKIAADAQHMESSGGYKISMGIGNTIYNCRSNGPASAFIDWAPGKEFPARINGKVMQVKNPNGQIVELNILKQKTAK
jgi:hypothetical protein